MSLAHDAEHAVAVFFAEVADVQSGGFEDPQTEQRPSRQTKAQSFGLAKSRAAASSASNCRWLTASVGDCVETAGRRT